MAEISPKIWSSFDRKKKDGTTLKLRVQEVTPERMEEAFEFTNTYLLSEEVIYRASGVYKSEEAVHEYIQVVMATTADHPPYMMICCVDDGSENGGVIAGISIASLDKDTDSLKETISKYEIQTPELKNLVKAGIALEEAQDLTKKHKLYYIGKGIVVHPDYRGLGIANEFVRLRGALCEENDVVMTAAWMTARGSQRAAENSNWKTYVEIQPEYITERSGLVFDKDTIPFKLMYTTKNEVK